MVSMKIHLPFSGKFPISLPFGAIPTSQIIIDKYKSLGLIGHNGIDYEMPEGTEICAAAHGIIEKVDFDNDFGNYITIQHSWGKSVYTHLKSTNVTKLQQIKVGKIIGLSGMTGFATGPHLHFGIKPTGSNLKNGYFGFIDPTEYFV